MKNKFSLLGCWSAYACLLFSLSCGGGGSNSTGGAAPGISEDFSSLSYPQATAKYLQTGQGAPATTKAFSEAHNAFLTLKPDNAANVGELQTALTNYSTALSSFGKLVSDLSALDDIVLGNAPSGQTVAETPPELFQQIGSLGVDAIVDDVNSLAQKLADKKAACEALFRQVPSLPTTPADFEKLERARQCVKEAQEFAVQAGFDAAVVNVGGGVVGGAAGAAGVIYFGGTVLSGGGLLVIGVVGFIGSKVASYIFTSCTGSSSNLVRPEAETLSSGFSSCAVSSAKGVTGQSLPLKAIGTGALQVFVEGCAPVGFGNITIADGQAVAINIECEPADDNVKKDDVTGASQNSSATMGEPAPGTCAEVVNIGVTTTPSDPGPFDNVSVTVATLAPAAGCSLRYAVAGTDGYSAANTLTTDAAGQATFGIPAAKREGVVDTVVVTEATFGLSTTITYTF